MEILISEVIFINQYMPGVFSYQDLKGMDFDEYEYVLSMARRIKESKNG